MYFLPLLLSLLQLGASVPFDPFHYFNSGSKGILDRMPDKLGQILPNLNMLDRLSSVYRPWLNLPNRNQVIKTDDDGFKIVMDVKQYTPEEITVKVEDNYLIVNGKQKNQDGSKQFTLKYSLPENVDGNQETHFVSSDGVLTIIVPLKPTDENTQVEQTEVPNNVVDKEQVNTEQVNPEQVDTVQDGVTSAGQTDVVQSRR